MQALNSTGRHIYYSVQNEGAESVWDWAGPIAN